MSKEQLHVSKQLFCEKLRKEAVGCVWIYIYSLVYIEGINWLLVCEIIIGCFMKGIN